MGADLDQVRVVVTVRVAGTWTFQTEVMHRHWAEMIFAELPYGPFQVADTGYGPNEASVFADVKVGGGWVFTSEPMRPTWAQIVLAELRSSPAPFDVASGLIVPEER